MGLAVRPNVNDFAKNVFLLSQGLHVVNDYADKDGNFDCLSGEIKYILYLRMHSYPTVTAIILGLQNGGLPKAEISRPRCH